MNTTVKRIVELMFQDVEMNDEVQAIHDEVLNNCQERFDDLTTRGYDEDEAIAAVAESLKGMEEILREYPRRQPVDAQTAQEPEQTPQASAGKSFPAGALRSLEVEVISESISIEASDDDDVHVLYDEEALPFLRVAEEDGALRIKTDRQAASMNRDASCEEQRAEDASFSFAALGQLLGSFLKNVGHALNESGRICIELPEWKRMERVCLRTTCGDVKVCGGAMETLEVDSTSGDVHMDLSGEAVLHQLRIRTTSGDVMADCQARSSVVQTMSGDVEFYGGADELHVSTISGDVELQARLRQVHVKTISGDVNVLCDGETIHEMTGSTTSGDIYVQLPAEVGPVEANVHSTSGDVRCRNSGNISGVSAHLTLKSVSGDIAIR